MTTLDLFRTFSSEATSKGYSSSSRILYYTLLWCWNEQRRPSIAAVSSKQLMMLTGLPEATFREAFSYLADRGWVKRVKLRRRGITAWELRNGCDNAAPPAGFLLSPAQRKSDRGVEESPHGDSSTTLQSTEVPANVREHNQPNNAGNGEGAPGAKSPQRTQPANDDEVPGGPAIEVPDLEL